MRHARWLRGLPVSTIAVISACAAAASDPGTLSASDDSPAVHMLPLHPADTGEVDQAVATSFMYFGGPLLTNVLALPVFWNASTQFQGNLNAFYKAIPNSTYFDLLREYRINRGSGQNGVVDTRATANVSDAAIRNELVRLISAGIVPPPNANTYYPVHFPPGMTITAPDGSQSCVVFCAYHSSFTVNGTNVNYAVVPDQGGGCAGGCGTNAQRVNNLDAVSSGELVDAVTDPVLGQGWFNPTLGEITAPCGQQTTVTGGDGHVYTVVKFFSVSGNRCVP